MQDLSRRSAIFEQSRSRLFGLAYRMLGAKADAEDMVQEAYLRWHQTKTGAVRTPEAWLVTTVTRLCLDRLRVARVEREAYIGPWLPEPLLTGEAAPPDRRAELASDLSIAFLALLERLAPEEHAAFLLHDVFECAYAELAQILGKSEGACRQLVHRARGRVQRNRPRFAVSETARLALLNQFVAAVRACDQDALLALFAADATWTADGGGQVRAARQVVRGAERLTRLVLGVVRRSQGQVTYDVTPINGETGLLLRRDGRLCSILAIDTDGTRIWRRITSGIPKSCRGWRCRSRTPRDHPAVTK